MDSYDMIYQNVADDGTDDNHQEDTNEQGFLPKAHAHTNADGVIDIATRITACLCNQPRRFGRVSHLQLSITKQKKVKKISHISPLVRSIFPTFCAFKCKENKNWISALTS